MDLYFTRLAIATCLLTVVTVILLQRSRKESARRKAAEAQLISQEREYRTLLASAERQTQELKLLDQVRMALARELDLSVMMRTVVEAIAETFGYTQVSIYLLQGDILKLQHQVGYETFIQEIPISKGVSGRVARTGKPVLLKDVRSDPEFLGAIRGISSEICIPLFEQEQVVGILNLETIQGMVFDEADMTLISALSDHINIAITRARLHALVRESEVKYRSVVDSIDEVIFQTNMDGKLVFLNPAWFRLTGYSMEESLDTQIRLYIHPEDRRLYADLCISLLDQEIDADRCECRYVHRDGDVHLTEVNARRTENGGGRITGLFGTIRDITERKRVDEERLRLSKLEAISPLAGGIAHDFNNLLTGILGHISFARMMLKPDADDLLGARLEMTERAAIEAQKLTQQLLTFARGGAPVRQISSIRDIIFEAAMFTSRGSNVRCDFSIPDDLWLADVDSGQIGQALQNLILNAQQAMPDGGVIRISAGNVELARNDVVPRLSAGPYVSITVKDEGSGIPADVLPKIFDPYFTTKSKGTGLGLATSHSIMTNHNGAITVESALDKGTAFTLYIPASPASSIDRKEEQRIHYQGSGRILVMEDEKGVRNLLADILKLCGYTATLTQDGAEAVEAYIQASEAGAPYDAVIMDLTVPGGMGGKEAVVRILAKDPKAIVIVSSGYSNDPVLANYREYGFAGIVPKPYKSTQLSKALHDILSEHQSETDQEESHADP